MERDDGPLIVDMVLTGPLSKPCPIQMDKKSSTDFIQDKEIKAYVEHAK